ncbi:MAG: cytochrome P450 [Planctomycetota bacterium]
MQISTELPTVSAAQLQPLEGEDQPAAVLRAVGALGGIAQSLRPNGRPGTVMVTEPSLVKQVLVRGSMDEDLGLIRNFALRTAAPHGLISLSGPEHRKVRVAAAPCFRGNGLAPLESALDRRLERGLDDWTCGTPVSASKLVLDLLTKVFMEWVLGPLDPDREAELCAAEQSLLEVFHHAVPDLNQLWPSGDGQGPVSFEEMVGRFFRLRTLISDTVERGPQGMMAQLDQMLPPQGEGLPRSAQLTDHAIHLLLAGLDTVSQTVGLLMHHVGHDDALGDAIADEAAHEERPFTEACMKEILRLYAGVPVAVRVTGAPVEVRGHVIPSHRPLMAFLICMQRDPRSFERPLDFVPERWLPGTELRMDASAYMPFGTGPHICIGESAAKLIMRRLMPAACSRFRMRTERPGLVPVLVRIVALPMRAPKVILTARR